jgi:bacterioferritin (cytochrome b1)
MQGNPTVITFLQGMLPLEAHLNLTYRNDWRRIYSMGVKGSAHKLHKLGNRAHQFMKQVDDRLLDFKADTNYTVRDIVGQNTVTDTFKADLALESALIEMGRAGIKLSVGVGDETTAEQLRHIEERHEEDAVWLEEQLGLIAGMGEPFYIGAHLKK